MEGSSLFAICPSCRVRARIQPAPGGHRCLSCNFDFASLAGDPAALERWMEDNLRDGSVEMTITLHHLITHQKEPESRALVLAFAEARGIALPKGGCGVVAIVALLLVLCVIAAAVVFFVAQ